jgi:hypothetical protein
MRILRPRQFQMILPLLGLLFLGSGNSLRADTLAASADITATQVSPGLFLYDLTLHNVGTTNIGTFWFAWDDVPSAGFLPAIPTSILSPTSWNEIITNGAMGNDYAIEWNATPGSQLTPGNSLSGFEFESTATPAQLAGFSPAHPTFLVGSSFVYIGLPFGDPGFQFVATVNPVASTPEPSSLLLFAWGLFGLAGIARRKLLH